MGMKKQSDQKRPSRKKKPFIDDGLFVVPSNPETLWFDCLQIYPVMWDWENMPDEDPLYEIQFEEQLKVLNHVVEPGTIEREAFEQIEMMWEIMMHPDSEKGRKYLEDPGIRFIKNIPYFHFDLGLRYAYLIAKIKSPHVKRGRKALDGASRSGKVRVEAYSKRDLEIFQDFQRRQKENPHQSVHEIARRISESGVFTRLDGMDSISQRSIERIIQKMSQA